MKKWEFNKAVKWYIYNPENNLGSEDCKILRNFPTQTDKTLEHNQPDITVIDEKSRKCLLIDPPCPFDIHTERKEEKCTNYSEKVEVLEVVIGALEAVTKHFDKWIEKLDLDFMIEAL